MTPELQKKIFEDYPMIFRQKDLECTQSCMCWGIECGDGWHGIIRGLCETLKNLHDNYGIITEATQVKEKYGTLRFYYITKSGTDMARDMVGGAAMAAESISAYTCEKCGRYGEAQEGPWIHTLCDECKEERTDSRQRKNN